MTDTFEMFEAVVGTDKANREKAWNDMRRVIKDQQALLDESAYELLMVVIQYIQALEQTIELKMITTYQKAELQHMNELIRSNELIRLLREQAKDNTKE